MSSSSSSSWSLLWTSLVVLVVLEVLLSLLLFVDGGTGDDDDELLPLLTYAQGEDSEEPSAADICGKFPGTDRSRWPLIRSKLSRSICSRREMLLGLHFAEQEDEDDEGADSVGDGVGVGASSVALGAIFKICAVLFGI